MTLLEFLLLAPVSLFVIVSPLSTAPLFLAMTEDNTPQERTRQARTACILAGCVLLVFALLGRLIFQALGITIEAFQVAGGIILFVIALEMVHSSEFGRKKLSREEQEMASEKDDVAVTPMGVPLIAGPGSISTTILLQSQAETLYQYLVLLGSIILVMGVAYGIFHLASYGGRWLSPILQRVVRRLMGLLLAAVAVQFVLNGLSNIGALPSLNGH